MSIHWRPNFAAVGGLLLTLCGSTTASVGNRDDDRFFVDV